VHKEENDLSFYKNKLAEQVEATREILGNYQLISRRSKLTEGLAERYKGEINKHKDYLSHLLEQQTAALSAYKNKIIVLNREKTAYRTAYHQLRQEFETYQEVAQKHFKQISQNQEQIERLKVYMKKLEDFIKLQYEKKEFYKSELRKRVIQELEFEERENAYLHQIQQYEQAILYLRTNHENNSTEEATEDKPEQNKEDKQEEDKQEEDKQEIKQELKQEERT